VYQPPPNLVADYTGGIGDKSKRVTSAPGASTAPSDAQNLKDVVRGKAYAGVLLLVLAVVAVPYSARVKRLVICLVSLRTVFSLLMLGVWLCPAAVISMVRAFQVRGHFIANIDPLDLDHGRRGFVNPQVPYLHV